MIMIDEHINHWKCQPSVALCCGASFAAIIDVFTDVRFVRISHCNPRCEFDRFARDNMLLYECVLTNWLCYCDSMMHANPIIPDSDNVPDLPTQIFHLYNRTSSSVRSHRTPKSQNLANPCHTQNHAIWQNSAVFHSLYTGILTFRPDAYTARCQGEHERNYIGYARRSLRQRS